MPHHVKAVGLRWAPLIALVVLSLSGGFGAMSKARSQQGAPSPLFARNHAVVPAPQKVDLREGDFALDASWRLVAGKGVSANDIAVEILKQELRTRFQLSLQAAQAAQNTPALLLEIDPGAVAIGEALDRDREVLAREAYKMELAPRRIRIVANAAPGLLYGVTSLIQMLKPQAGAPRLPEGEVADWPDLQLRLIFWDDAHHVERVEEFKRIIRQAAFFKINAIALKLEGHFQFKSAPALVEPHAWSPRELQELTDYGLRHHLQLIPWIDGPAHVAFILKHPEYAHLRAFPDSNYQFCSVNPESVKLLLGMYNDLIDANKGVGYIYFSTDEPYYMGMADNPQCRESARAKELGGNSKVLVEYINKLAEPLRALGRKVVFMGENPLEPGDIASLPPYLINTLVMGPKFDPLYKARGIRQMLHTSTQGEEDHFPNYFMLPDERRLHPLKRQEKPRIEDGFEMISGNEARQQADVLGVINAGWADAGVHPETFWMGYAAITAAGWRPKTPDHHEVAGSFYRAFYGPGAVRMERLYQLMSYQAQAWADSWERGQSTARKTIFGSSRRIAIPRYAAEDYTLELPEVPAPNDLGYSYPWTWANRRRLELSTQARAEYNELQTLLKENLGKVQTNRYNLEVFESIAGLYGENLDFLDGMSKIDKALAAADEASRNNRAQQAVASIDQAMDQALALRKQRNAALRRAEQVWYKSWQPRVLTANGRRFYHQLDDVKDHEPDRTVDMSYLVYRELLLPFDEWYEKVRASRNTYATKHGLPSRSDSLAWRGLDF